MDALIAELPWQPVVLSPRAASADPELIAVSDLNERSRDHCPTLRIGPVR